LKLRAKKGEINNERCYGRDEIVSRIAENFGLNRADAKEKEFLDYVE